MAPPPEASQLVHSAGASPTAAVLDLEPSPYEEHAWDETQSSQDHKAACEDDVNGMSTLFKSGGHSYLGISSVPAILRILARTSPQLRRAIKERGSSSAFYPPIPIAHQPPTVPTFDEPSLIDAYFRTVHAVTPMVDEIDFRQRYSGGEAELRSSSKSPWLALFNMVLTLGYIAANDDTQSGHGFFYGRAAEHLKFTCFETGHIYTLQALILYGGYYLHYLNKPNVASAVMGAAHRMALALGLHRLPNLREAPQAGRSSIEFRSRTWLCLFCLDTWAGTTLGRPEMGAWSLCSMAIPVAQSGRDLVSTGFEGLMTTNIVSHRITMRSQ